MSGKIEPTPGPWRIREESSRAVTTIIAGDETNPREICEFPYIWREDIANATLIVAAPDLLAALKTLLEETEYFAAANDPATLAAKAAIAKAEGRTP